MELIGVSSVLSRDAAPDCRAVQSMAGLLGEGSAPVVGYSTLVVAGNGPGFYSETYYAPALGCVPLLEVTLDRVGIRMTRAVQVIPGDPPVEVFEPRLQGPSRARIEAILRGHLHFPAVDEDEISRQRSLALGVASPSAATSLAPGSRHGRIGPGGTFFLGG